MCNISWARHLKGFQLCKSKKDRKQAWKCLSEAECVACLEITQCHTTSECNHSICQKCLGKFITVTHHSIMPCPCPSSAICPAQFNIDDVLPFVDDSVLDKIYIAKAAKLVENGFGMYC